MPKLSQNPPSHGLGNSQGSSDDGNRVLGLFKSAVTGVGNTLDNVKGGFARLGRPSGRQQLIRQTTHPIQLAASEAMRVSQRLLNIHGAEAEKDAPPGRVVRLLGEDGNKAFPGNKIKTAKYNLVTFLPIFLWEVFSRAAYLYFLVQAILSWISVVSPFGGWGSTLALAFVVIVAGVKATLEDLKRHTEDRRTNGSVAHLMQRDGTALDVHWRDIKVGQVVRVDDDELFPADLLCLHTALTDSACFVKTTNLDGESNLKIRRPVDLKESSPETKQEVLELAAVLSCEAPNQNLHTFKGRLVVEGNGPKRTVPVTMNEMLLRGCTLKNSGHVLGLVVYTGPQTRIQMNAAKTPNKIGSFDSFLNFQIGFIIILQFALCIFSSVAGTVWREKWGRDRYQLALDNSAQGNVLNSAGFWGILLVTFWILYSYLVPISLFVTLEIVKFWQGFVFINFDSEMKDPQTGEYAKARNTNLNEDLGKIDYVFSDKTGTLTSNEMRLRELAVKGATFGSAKFKLEDHPGTDGAEMLHTFDGRLSAAVEAARANGKWAELVQKGGSSKELLAAQSLGPGVEDGHGQGMGARGSPSQSPSSPSHQGSAPLQSSPSARRHPAGQPAPPETLASHLLDFWLCICLCHSLIVVEDEEEEEEGEEEESGGREPNGGANGGVNHSAASRSSPSRSAPSKSGPSNGAEKSAADKSRFQGPSPDEVALVEAGQQLGFEFLQRTKQGVRLRMAGVEADFEVLNVLEYSSARGSMSVIVRCPDGSIRVFTKGSDAKVLGMLRKGGDSTLLAKTHENLHLFATQGLRTLAVATRLLDADFYADWDFHYQEAAGQLEHRDEAIDEMAREVETDLELIGVTAIEDKLQDGVPAAIQTLLDAGIKVWVITGDKQETAINIAISCHLIRSQDSLLICNAKHRAGAKARLEDLRVELRRRYAPVGGPKSGPAVRDGAVLTPVHAGELVIDGGTLDHIVGDAELEPLLAQVGAQCSAVVVCRSSPSQKAAIVRIMREYELQQATGTSTGLWRWYKRAMRAQAGRMLAIGDGANDVAMIQAADVGVGIMGKEGRQATNNADYAVTQFRFLVRLLLVHGTLSAYRIARLIKYSFYKNIAFGLMLFYYQFYNGFSGQALVDDISAAAYNVVFTSMPVLLFAIMDRPTRDFATLLRFPQTYNARQALTTMAFWKNGVLMAAVDAAVCFFFSYYAIEASGQGSASDVYSVGKTVFIALLGVVTLEIALVSRYWTFLFGFFLFLSYAVVYPFVVVYPLILMGLDEWDVAQFGVGENLFRTGTFWFVCLATAVTGFGHRLVERGSVWLFRPQDYMLMTELEKLEGPAMTEGKPNPRLGWQTAERLRDLFPSERPQLRRGFRRRWQRLREPGGGGDVELGLVQGRGPEPWPEHTEVEDTMILAEMEREGGRDMEKAELGWQTRTRMGKLFRKRPQGLQDELDREKGGAGGAGRAPRQNSHPDSRGVDGNGRRIAPRGSGSNRVADEIELSREGHRQDSNRQDGVW